MIELRKKNQIDDQELIVNYHLQASFSGTNLTCLHVHVCSLFPSLAYCSLKIPDKSTSLILCFSKCLKSSFTVCCMHLLNKGYNPKSHCAKVQAY